MSNTRLKDWQKKFENSYEQKQLDRLDEISYQVPRLGTYFEYVGFWRRFFAYVIDTIILYVIFYFTKVSTDNYLMTTVIWTLYSSILICSSIGGTIGKVAIGARVTDQSGNRVSFIRAVIRSFLEILSALLFGIGFLMIAFHSKKRGLHDLIAGTMVVNKR